MTYEEIFTQTKELILANDLSGIHENIAIQINIVGEGEGAFYIALKDGVVSVEPYEYYDRDCIFTISGENFLKICSGALNPVKAFTIGKLKIEGSIEKALAFSKIIEDVKKKPVKSVKKKKEK